MKRIAESLDSREISKTVPLFARRFVRYLLGFGVGVAVGLAPFLGRAKVPGFSALLLLMPDSLQDFVYTVSAFLMATVAVWVQWHAGSKPTRQWQKRTFHRFLLITLTSLAAFLTIQPFVVVTIRGAALSQPVSFLIGLNTPTERPPCVGYSDPVECIQRLTFNEARIETYWGYRQLAISRLALIFPYLLVMTGFGGLVGVLLIREHTAHPQDRSTNARPRKRPRPVT